jgi:RHS repeat-associated protein
VSTYGVKPHGNSFVVGRGKANSAAFNPFAGSIDNVQVYQRVLTPAEITGLYQAGRGGAALTSSALTTSFQYNQLGQVMAKTDPMGHITRFAHDEAGRLVRTETPSVSTETGGVVITAPVVTTAGFDTFGGQTEARDGQGNVTTVSYDANGRAFQITSPEHAGITRTRTSIYDDMGRIESTEDEIGRETAYTYNKFGQPLTVTTPDAGVTTYTYHPNGQVASVTDPLGARTESTYDYLGRISTATQLVRRPSQATVSLVTSYTYGHQAGWLTSVTSPEPGRVSAVPVYNNVGETVQLTDPFSNVTRYGYDFAGRGVWTQAPDGSRSTTAYDQAGRPVAQRAFTPAGVQVSQKSAVFDANSQITSVKDPAGRTITYAYNAIGQLTQTTQPISTIESITNSFGYDARGNRTRYTDGRANAFHTTYNAWNLPETETDPGGAVFTSVYDDAGRLSEFQSPGGVANTYTYDIMSNVESIAGSGAEVATPTKTFGYDAAGRVTSLSGGGGTNTLSYDDRGLLLSATGPMGDSSFTWTNDGLPATRTDEAGTTSYSYDAAGRLAAAANDSLLLSFSYNSQSQVSQINYGYNQSRRVFTYDEMHRPATDELKTSGGLTTAKITYGWDANSNLISKDTTGFSGAASNTYGYDHANRLTSWNGVAYAYDKSGNRTQAGSKTYSYDSANRLQSASDGTTYTYTARGTLSGTTVGTVTLDTVSDAFGQAVKQYSATGDFSEYSYDGLGRMLQPGLSYTGVGNDLAADPTASYIRGPSGDLLGTQSGGVSTYTWTDLHTDVVGQFAAGGASLSGSVTYDPYGKVVSTAGLQGSLGYQSEWTDPETKRVNMHARWYNPETGQFDSRDSVAVPNRFNYALNNPLGHTDPSGHAPPPEEYYDYGTRKVSPPPRQDPAPSDSDLPPCQRSVEWRMQHQVQNCGGSTAPPGSPGFNGRTGQTVNGCAHGNYDWVFANCTTVFANEHRWCINELCGDIADLHGLNPAIIAAEVDREVGRRGGYNNVPGNVQTLTSVIIADAIDRAATRQADLDARNAAAEAEAKCAADFVCRNAGVIGAVAGAVVGVVVGAICTAASVGVGALGCAVIAGAIGGAIAGAVTQGILVNHGMAENSFSAWAIAVGGGAVIGAVSAVLFAGAGALAGAAVRAAGRTAVGQAARAAAGKAASTVTAKISSGTLFSGGIRNAVSNVQTKIASSSCGTKIGLSAAAAGAGELAPTLMHSFDPDTMVLMADGSAKKIKDIDLGEQVIATDPVTGETSAQPVTALHENTDLELTDVTVTPLPSQPPAEGDPSPPGPAATLHTTAHHPFWDVTTSSWVHATDLQLGSSVLTGPDGQLQQVTEVRDFDGPKRMRDLTVANIHTYYVMAADTPVLVHNCGGKATFSWDPNRRHAYIEVDAGNGSPVRSHAIPIDSPDPFGGSSNLNTPVLGGNPGPGSFTREFDLPNAQGALDFIDAQVNTPGNMHLRDYSPGTNDCISYCASVLHAGGLTEFVPGKIGTDLLRGLIPPNLYRPGGR